MRELTAHQFQHYLNQHLTGGRYETLYGSMMNMWTRGFNKGEMVEEMIRRLRLEPKLRGTDQEQAAINYILSR